MEKGIMEKGIMVKGSFRLNIVDPDGKVVGDTGWQENQIVNLGFQYFLCYSLAGSAGSTPTIGFVALGTGSAPGAADTALDGEVSKRTAVTAATSNTSKAVQFTATFASSGNFVTATKNISNIGLFASSSVGTLFSGNTFASSSCATNQAVSVTYTITFT